MKTLKAFLSICIIISINSFTLFAQDTWKSADGQTKYTAPTDVQTDFQKSNAGKSYFPLNI